MRRLLACAVVVSIAGISLLASTSAKATVDKQATLTLGRASRRMEVVV